MMMIMMMISAAVCMGLSSLNFLTHLYTYRVRISRSVIQGQFGTNRKRVCDFVLVRYSDLGPILHRF